MLASYRRVFAHQGALAFSSTGMLGRLPIAMMTLGIVVLVSALTGSYAQAGQLSAAYIIGSAAFAVQQGQLADRFGQARVLYVDAAVFSVATALMIMAIDEDWPLPVPHLLAAVSGAAMPLFGGLVRSRWIHLLGDEAERNTAFALEGVVDEVGFVTGPVLVTLLSTLLAPQAGLWAALLIGATASVALGLQRGTEPPPHPRDRATRRDPMGWAVLVPLTAGAFALGSLFGAQEVATVAFAGDAGHRGVSGLMLGLYALGSALAGIVTGAVTIHRSSVQRARAGLVMLALGSTILPLLPGLVLVSAGLFVTGLALAPTLIAVFAILESTAPRSRLNEAMGFLSTGVAAGIAPGAWVAGIVADDAGGSAAYWVGAASALVAVATMFLVPEVVRHDAASTRFTS